jgi:FkbM family methyltransferase
MRTLVLNEAVAIVAGRDGYFLVNRNDIYVGQAIEGYGEYNGEEASFLKRLTKRGDTVIEVGANIGSHTVGLANVVGPKGRVYAFEPQRACYALVQAQIALNRLTNTIAYNEGVGRERGKLFVPYVNYEATGNFGGVSLTHEAGPAAEPVDIVTLDDRFPDINPAMMKIDVEGMEEDVIRGGLNLIRRCHPLLYVENDRVDRSRSLIALLLEEGYRLWWHIPKLFSADNYFKVEQNIYGNVASCNMVCARNASRAFADLPEITSADAPHPAAPR